MKRNTTVLGTVLLAAALAGCVSADPAGTSADAQLPLDATTSDCLAELAAGRNVIPGRFIVSFRADRLSPLAADRDLAVTAALGARKSYVEIGVANAVAVDLSDAEVERLRADPRVAYVEPDGLACAFDDAGDEAGKGKPAPAPSCADGTQESIPAGITEINGAAALHTGLGVRVAVVDTGIDLVHPDLAEHIVGDATFIARTTTGQDDNGHGTHVAGTIGGIEDNGIGVVGVAPGTSLLAVKVLDRRGSGSYAAIASGIAWAVANGADVINMSLGGTADSQTLRDAVQAAFDADVVMAVAAGNESTTATSSYPGAYEGLVITVSAEDASTDGFPSWSNYGVPPVDLAAPGVSVCSCVRGGGYGLKSGTSMATPHVAGAAALVLEGNPALTPSEVLTALTAQLTPLADVTNHAEDLLNVTGL